MRIVAALAAAGVTPGRVVCGPCGSIDPVPALGPGWQEVSPGEPADLAVCVVGPRDADPAALAAVDLPPGQRVLILLGWAPADLPVAQLAAALSGFTVSAIQRTAYPRLPLLLCTAQGGGQGGQGSWFAALAGIRMDAAAAALAQASAARAHAESQLARHGDADTAAALARTEAALTEQRALTRAAAMRVDAIERSAAWQVGDLLVGVARRPRSAPAAVSRAAAIWRRRRSGPAAPADADGIDPLAPIRAWSRRAPAGGRGAPRIALIGPPRTREILASTAEVLVLAPHDAAVLLAGEPVDLLLIDTEAGSAGAWSGLGTPTGLDRAESLAAALTAARGAGVPSVVWRSAPRYRTLTIGSLLGRADLDLSPRQWHPGTALPLLAPLTGPLPPADRWPLAQFTGGPADGPAQFTGGPAGGPAQFTGGPADGPAQFTGGPAGGPQTLPSVAWGLPLRSALRIRLLAGDLARTPSLLGDVLAAGAAADVVGGWSGTRWADRPPPGAREVGSTDDGFGPVLDDQTWLAAVREIWQDSSTPVMLDDVLEMVGADGSPRRPARKRRVTVILDPGTEQAVAGSAVTSILQQRHRPAEVIVIDRAADQPAISDRALSEISWAGITVTRLSLPGPDGGDHGGAEAELVHRVLLHTRSHWLTRWHSTTPVAASVLCDCLIAAEIGHAELAATTDPRTPVLVTAGWAAASATLPASQRAVAGAPVARLGRPNPDHR